MCIAVWLLDQHPSFWLILALNRDEFLSRPTLAAHFWDGNEEENHILGGRDVRSGGTWMGITKSGRFAFVTNVRYNDDRPLKLETTRGDLPKRFFTSNKTPLDYAHEIAQEAEEYNLFNLVVADVKEGEMAFVSNRGRQGSSVVQKVLPGLHSLSNGTLDGKWPKMERGKKLFTALLAESSSVDGEEIPSKQFVQKILRDTQKPDDVSAEEAETLYGERHEIPLSSIFVETEVEGLPYGTRSMAVVGIRRDGRVSLFERYLEDNEWKDHSFEFQVDKKYVS